MEDTNPQARQMADESMVRNLAAQAEAIWPQESRLLRAHPLPAGARILDAGCGTGEVSWRLAELFPDATVLGVDLLEVNLERARARCGRLGARLRFERHDVFELGVPDRTFDLAVCRHVIQAIPRAERALAELVRVTRPGGRLHLVAEDYGMIHFPPRRLDPLAFWPEVPRRFGPTMGIDLFVGRKTPGILHGLGVRSIAVDYVVVDTIRVRREIFAAIWEAWRDGYADEVAARCGMTREEVVAHFDDQLATIRDPAAYAAWLVPVVSGVVT